MLFCYSILLHRSLSILLLCLKLMCHFLIAYMQSLCSFQHAPSTVFSLHHSTYISQLKSPTAPSPDERGSLTVLYLGIWPKGINCYAFANFLTTLCGPVLSSLDPPSIDNFQFLQSLSQCLAKHFYIQALCSVD